MRGKEKRSKKKLKDWKRKGGKGLEKEEEEEKKV